MDNHQTPPHILHFLAVGRLYYDANANDFVSGKHQLLCCEAPKDDHRAKQYKNHCKAIMNKGAKKLQPNKRIRLTSDSNDYDLHVLTDELDSDRAKTLVFFAVTSPDFAKHHTVTGLLRDFKNQFYEAFTNYNFGGNSDSSSSSFNRQAQPMLTSLFAHYDQSKLLSVSVKVDEIKNVMKSNVDKALMNVEHLEELEVKSEQFQEHARQFQGNSAKLKNMFRCRYYKINLILALFVLAIIAYIIYAIYSKVHG